MTEQEKAKARSARLAALKEKFGLDLYQDKDYAAAFEKLQELHKRRREVQAMLDAPATNPKAIIQERAERLLNGNTEPEKPATPSRQELHDRLVVLQRAIQLQTDRVKGERLRASREMRARLNPERRKILRAMADSMKKLVASAESHRDLMDVFESEQIVSWPLRGNAALPVLDRLRYWLTEYNSTQFE